MNCSKTKFAVVSNVLPPSTSGQAIMLYRLLEGLPSKSYCLISNEDYERVTKKDSATLKLPARYYHLKPHSLLSKLIYIIHLLGLLETYHRAKQITKIIRDENCNVLIACTGDLYNLPAAYLACKWAGIPFVPYIFDDYANQWNGINRLISKWLEPKLLKNSNGIIVTNECMQEEYLCRYGVQSTVIHNPCLMPDLVELDKAKKIFNDKEINIVYTGSIYEAHYDAFRNLIKALQKIGRSDVKFHIYTSKPQSKLKRHGIAGSMVVHQKHVNNFDIPKILRQADILFLPLAFESPYPEVIRTSAPGKIGDYLSVGRPILIHSTKDSFISWYFRKNQCGIVVNENNPEILAKALVEIIEDKNMQIELGNRAIQAARKDFDISIVRTNFIKFLKSFEI